MSVLSTSSTQRSADSGRWNSAMRELLQGPFAEVSLTLQLSELIRSKYINNKSHVLASNASGNAAIRMQNSPDHSE